MESLKTFIALYMCIFIYGFWSDKNVIYLFDYLKKLMLFGIFIEMNEKDGYSFA